MKPILYYDDSWPLAKFTGIPQQRCMIPHLGQRKLLINEVAFLHLHGNLSDKVLYVGAAPGPHINVLADLFPNHKFYLYDPREFDTNLNLKLNVKTYQKYFTDQEALKYKKCLFISDIRTGGTDFEKEVEYNLTQQKKWCDIIEPVMTSLKFRMPFTKTDKIIPYYRGKICLQSWCGIDSNETRLWTDCKKQTNYSTHDFEQRMFHYNLNLRLGDYDIGQLNIPGMDACNDCAIEYHTWSLIGDPRELVNKYPQSFNISPHGLLNHLSVEERVKKLEKETEIFYNKYHKNEEIKALLNKETKRKGKK